MATGKRRALLVAAGLLVAAWEGIATAQEVAQIEAAPGTLVRWSAPGTKSCGMGRQSWPALQETCYYPIDLLQPAGPIRIVRRGAGRPELARIMVVATDYGTEEVELPDIPQANPSRADLQRNAREQLRLGRLWRTSGPARFTLPLGAPAQPFPEGHAFGAKRIFNGKPADQPHTGADYPLPLGTPVVSAADGRVVLADDLFFAGNAVLIDHGDGLITMYFHLSDFEVRAGQEVKKGERIGHVGSTGRATGPHLFFGARWHNARIDPALLIGDPAKLPAVAP
jgi:murein DD-endopeptidase MepM/ murein hydrolase activator NlpD